MYLVVAVSYLLGFVSASVLFFLSKPRSTKHPESKEKPQQPERTKNTPKLKRRKSSQIPKAKSAQDLTLCDHPPLPQVQVFSPRGVNSPGRSFSESKITASPSRSPRTPKKKRRVRSRSSSGRNEIQPLNQTSPRNSIIRSKEKRKPSALHPIHLDLSKLHDYEQKPKNVQIAPQTPDESTSPPKKTHKRSRSDTSMEEDKKIKKNVPNFKVRTKSSKQLLTGSRQAIYKNAIQMGWVRVQVFSISEKHSIWTKRFLILCIGEMYLMKSQDLFADCAMHVILTHRVLSKMREKIDRCDILLSNSLTSSLPNVKDETKSVKLSLRHSIEEWLGSFEKCIGQVPLKNEQTITQSSGETPTKPLSLNLSLIDSPQPQKKQELELDCDIEMSKRLSSPPPSRESSFTESVNFYFPADGSWRKRMVKLKSGIINIYDSVGSTVALQGIIYLAGCKITPLNNLQQPIAPAELENGLPPCTTLLRITQTNLSGILSRYSPSGTELADYFDNCSVDLQFPSPSILRASVDTLQRAIELNVAPLENLVPLTPQQSAAMYACDFDVLTSPRERANFSPDRPFNIVIYRYFKDLQNSEAFHKAANDFISKQANLAYRPDFIGPFTVENLDFSKINFFVSDSQFSRFPDNPTRVIGEISFGSSGSVTTEVSSTLNLNLLVATLKGVSVTATVIVSNIQGKIPDVIGSRTECFFAQIPSYDLDIDFSFTQKKFSLAKTIPKLRQFIVDGIRTTIRDRFVYPNKITFFLPFAGRPIAMRMQQVGSHSVEAQMSPIEALKESASRFIDEILQLHKTEIIPSVCTENCKIFGFHPEGLSMDGFDGVEDVADQLQNAFNNPVFSVTDVQIVNKTLEVGFVCSGKMKGSLWKHFHSSVNTIELQGHMHFNCDYNKDGSAKLQKIKFLWDLNSVARIFSLPLALSPKLDHFAFRSLRQTS